MGFPRVTTVCGPQFLERIWKKPFACGGITASSQFFFVLSPKLAVSEGVNRKVDEPVKNQSSLGPPTLFARSSMTAL